MNQFEKRIDEIKSRLKKANPGPWSKEPWKDGQRSMVVYMAPKGKEALFGESAQGVFMPTVNADLVANSRDDIEWLLEQLLSRHYVNQSRLMFIVRLEPDVYLRHEIDSMRTVVRDHATRFDTFIGARAAMIDAKTNTGHFKDAIIEEFLDDE